MRKGRVSGEWVLTMQRSLFETLRSHLLGKKIVNGGCQRLPPSPNKTNKQRRTVAQTPVLKGKKKGSIRPNSKGPQKCKIFYGRCASQPIPVFG